MTLTILLNQNSKILILLYNFPAAETVNAIKNANIITGNAVAIENANGSNKPSGLDKVIGISIKKYKTPLYGQNAKANIIPKNSTLQKEPVLLFSSALCDNLPSPGNLILIISSIKTPIIINKKPKNRSPYVAKKLCTAPCSRPSINNPANAT